MAQLVDEVVPYCRFLEIFESCLSFGCDESCEENSSLNILQSFKD
jgi:hypothetical protein